MWFPDDLVEQIRRAAEASDRSFNYVVVKELRKRFPEKSPDDATAEPEVARNAIAGLKCPKATCKYTGPEDYCPWHKLALKPARNF